MIRVLVCLRDSGGVESGDGLLSVTVAVRHLSSSALIPSRAVDRGNWNFVVPSDERQYSLSISHSPDLLGGAPLNVVPEGATGAAASFNPTILISTFTS